MRLVILGPQGSGKGTQGQKLAEKYGIPHISTGDLLREIAEKDTPLGHEVKEIINKGEFVNDELLMRVTGKRLQEEDAKKGFVLDGTPRNVEQAKLIETVVEIDKAIFIHISDEEAVKRISARMSCPKDKTPYNKLFNPPKVEGKCDVCGGELVQREDDTPEAVRFRLQQYHERTQPVEDYYKEKGKLIKIDGEQTIEDVWKDIQESLS